MRRFYQIEGRSRTQASRTNDQNLVKDRRRRESSVLLRVTRKRSGIKCPPTKGREASRRGSPVLHWQWMRADSRLPPGREATAGWHRRSPEGFRSARAGIGAVDQADRPAVGRLEPRGLGVDPELVVEDPGQVGGGDGALGGCVAGGVGPAEDEAAGRARAERPGRCWPGRGGRGRRCALILGVRPNSPIITTSVSSSRPRSARSSSSAATPLSSGGASVFLIVGKFCGVGVPAERAHAAVVDA